ncbi:MAG: methyltransferase domain-containing protein [Acidobacteriota bacterium]
MRPFDLVRQLLPKPVRRRLLRWTRRPSVGRVDLGQLRRLKPISRDWGGDRGRPLDRTYIEQFLAEHADAIRGRMLEVGDATYTHQFGGDRVERAEVVTAATGTEADYVADLVDAPELPSAAFSGIVCTQTLQLVRDPIATVATLHRILEPGGVLLITVPGASPLEIDADGRWLDRWRFTRHGLRTLLETAFEPSSIEVVGYGNVLASIAFFHGLAGDELSDEELDHRDERFDLLVAARAVRSTEATP